MGRKPDTAPVTRIHIPAQEHGQQQDCSAPGNELSKGRRVFSGDPIAGAAGHESGETTGIKGIGYVERVHRGPFSPPGRPRPAPAGDLSPGRVIVKI